jgi:hypothetical protein
MEMEFSYLLRVFKEQTGDARPSQALHPEQNHLPRDLRSG